MACRPSRATAWPSSHRRRAACSPSVRRLPYPAGGTIRGMTETSAQRVGIPRSKENDYTPEAARARQDFVRERTGSSLEHVSSYSFDPETTRGNVEHFTGVAQVPLGIAGPLLVNGEHAQGEFYVPLTRTSLTMGVGNVVINVVWKLVVVAIYAALYELTPL